MRKRGEEEEGRRRRGGEEEEESEDDPDQCGSFGEDEETKDAASALDRTQELELLEARVAEQEARVSELEAKLAEDWTNMDVLAAHRAARDELAKLIALKLPESMRSRATGVRPIELRHVRPNNPLKPDVREPRRQRH